MSDVIFSKRADNVIALLLVVPLVAGVMALRGWALAKLWLWFVVPTFGAAPLSSTTAYGVALLVGLASWHIPVDVEERERGSLGTLVRGASAGAALSLACVGAGALTRWWAS